MENQYSTAGPRGLLEDSSSAPDQPAGGNTQAGHVPSTRHAHRWADQADREAQAGVLDLERARDSAAHPVRALVDLVPAPAVELRHLLKLVARSARHRAAVHADSSSIRRPKKGR